MKSITHVSYCGEYGEADLFLDEQGELLWAWACNDALWREEYMRPLFLKLGIDIQTQQDDTTTEQEAKLKEWFGY